MSDDEYLPALNRVKIGHHWMREYRTLAVPFTNAERSALRLTEGALFRVARISGLPSAPEVDGCLVTFEPIPQVKET